MRGFRITLVASVALSCVACSSTIPGRLGAEDTDDGGAPDAHAGKDAGKPPSSDPNDGGSGSYDRDAAPVATRPPPSITSAAPLAGDYGAIVTIAGDNFDEASATLVLGSPTEPLVYRMPIEGSAPAPSDVIVKWSKTEIQFKYPFPAEGSIRIATASGQATGGTFVPSWTPGSPIKGSLGRRELLGAVSPSAGVLVAAFDGASGPNVVVADADGSLRANAFPRGGTALLQMSLYVNATGGVDGFYATDNTLWQLTDAAGSPATTSTGVTTITAAGGRDATGPYAWIKKSGSKVARVRPPTWSESGAAITDPTPASAPGTSMAVGPDDALIVGWGVNDGGSFPLYDRTARPVIARLRPGQSAFDASKSIGGGADDYMQWTRFRSGPEGRVVAYYCATDTGIGSPTTDCQEGYLGNGGPTLGYPDYDAVVGWNGAVAHVAACEKATSILKIGPEDDTSKLTPALFPCPQSITAVTVDPSGQSLVLVQSGEYVYSPRKR